MRRSDLELLAELVAERLADRMDGGVSVRDPFVLDPENPDNAVESMGIRAMAAQDFIDRGCRNWRNRGRVIKPGYTYAFRPWRGGLTKIGRADDPVTRLVDIQSCSPEPFVLVGLCHGLDIEPWLHHRYRDRRVYAEMFDLGDENPIPREGFACLGCRCRQ